jgi:CheY-like chemotaxis protein
MAVKGKIYCSDCREEVEPVSVSMGPDGIERLRCPNCGAFLDGGDDEFREALQEGEEFVFSDESISVPVFSTIYLVGYPEGVGSLVEGQILEKNFARDVHVLANGEELIVRLIQNLNSLSGDDIGLVIMEVPMPYLNGINAAIAMRAIERTYPAHKLIPILFLTHKGVDDTFKKVIKFLSPAKYAHLGPSDDSSKLAPRMNKIISLLAQEKW